MASIQFSLINRYLYIIGLCLLVVQLYGLTRNTWIAALAPIIPTLFMIVFYVNKGSVKAPDASNTIKNIVFHSFASTKLLNTILAVIWLANTTCIIYFYWNYTNQQDRFDANIVVLSAGGTMMESVNVSLGTSNGVISEFSEDGRVVFQDLSKRSLPSEIDIDVSFPGGEDHAVIAKAELISKTALVRIKPANVPIEIKYLTIRGFLVEKLISGQSTEEWEQIIPNPRRVIETDPLRALRKMALKHRMPLFAHSSNIYLYNDPETSSSDLGNSLVHSQNDQVSVNHNEYEYFDAVYNAPYLQPTSDMEFAAQCFVGCVPINRYDQPIHSYTAKDQCNAFSVDMLYEDLNLRNDWRISKSLNVDMNEIAKPYYEIPYGDEKRNQKSSIVGRYFGDSSLQKANCLLWRYARYEDFLDPDDVERRPWDFDETYIESISAIDYNIWQTSLTEYLEQNYNNYYNGDRYVFYQDIIGEQIPENFALIVAGNYKNYNDEPGSAVVLIPRTIAVKLLLIRNPGTDIIRLGNWTIAVDNNSDLRVVEPLSRDNISETNLLEAEKRKLIPWEVIAPGETIVVPLGIGFEYCGPEYDYLKVLAESSKIIHYDAANLKNDILIEDIGVSDNLVDALDMQMLWETASEKETELDELSYPRTYYYDTVYDVLKIEINGYEHIIRHSDPIVAEEHGDYFFQG